MSIHPPIPPNCSAFVLVNGRWQFRCDAFCLCVDVDDTDDRLSRTIIAAVAEVEWLKVSDGIEDELNCIGWSNQVTLMNENSHALSVAIRWRAWGDREKP